jgi:hypothetical protein
LLSLESVRVPIVWAKRFNDIFMMDGDVEGYLNLARNFESSKINTTRRIEEDINHLVLPKTK